MHLQLHFDQLLLWFLIKWTESSSFFSRFGMSIETWLLAIGIYWEKEQGSCGVKWSSKKIFVCLLIYIYMHMYMYVCIHWWDSIKVLISALVVGSWCTYLNGFGWARLCVSQYRYCYGLSQVCGLTSLIVYCGLIYFHGLQMIAGLPRSGIQRSIESYNFHLVIPLTNFILYNINSRSCSL